MGWTYRIIAPAEAAALIDDPGAYLPQTPLGTFRKISDWLTSRAARSHPQLGNCIRLYCADNKAAMEVCLVSKESVATNRELSQTNSPDWLTDYGPADDEPIVEIEADCHSRDLRLVAECAAALNAIVLECTTGAFITSQEWMQRIDASDDSRTP